MSDGASISYTFALTLANRMVEILSPDCQRIEIAGSLRRKKETVRDIEIVLIPKYIEDLFGGKMYGSTLIEAALIREGFVLTKNGDHFKQAHLASGGSVNFDIFLTTPDQWGVIFTIRTGSAAFSHWLVTARREGGGLPSHMRIKDGRLWVSGDVVETPEETDLFEKIGLEWIPPEKRERR
jgi:DNA polymerase/3'-5' exonuclease PolX